MNEVRIFEENKDTRRGEPQYRLNINSEDNMTNIRKEQTVFSRWLNYLRNRWRDNDEVSEWVAPATHKWQPWIEAFLLTVFACAVAWWLSPEDPLLLNQPFPWLWLAPLLIALRYGLMPGVFSVLLLTLDWVLYDQINTVKDQAFPWATVIGGVMLTMIGGEFNAIWKTRLERVDEANLYLQERMSRLTRRYFVLRFSHDRLEQEMLAKPGSLRDALLRLRDVKARCSDPDTPLPGVDYVLQLLSQYCQLEAAAVYLPRQDGKNRWHGGDAVAKIGEPSPLKDDDPMLAYAMEHGKVTHAINAPGEDSDHLVMAPILSGDGKVVALVVVSRMSFLALNRDTLQLMALLLGYYGDILRINPDIDPIQQMLPDCPYYFAEEMVRLSNVAKHVGVESHLIVMSFGDSSTERTIAEIERTHRSLDMTWHTQYGVERPAVCVLLPFASAVAATQYLARIERWFSEQFGDGFDTRKVQINKFSLGASLPLAELNRLLHNEEIGYV